MAVNFQLIPRGTDTPMKLSEVDNLLRKYFDEPEDKVNYLQNWYNVFGWRLASGESLSDLAKHFEEHEAFGFSAICMVLDARFEVYSWRD